jgi:hypothetical protein
MALSNHHRFTIIGVIGFLLMVASGHWFLSGILPH